VGTHLSKERVNTTIQDRFSNNTAVWRIQTTI